MKSTKKYQVFVSSTYEDLREERQEIIHALLELDCIPSGMELFPAADEDQWSLIRGVIDECDYYILVLGGRYGTIGPDGVGYTEKEYQYALEKAKPIIAFLHKDPDSLPKKRTEETPDGQSKFKDFRELAQKKMCKYWTSAHELGSIVSRSLIMLQRRHPGVGWVKGDLVPDKESSLEILELRKEIEKLQKKLQEARTQAPPGTEKLAQGEDMFEISYNCKSEKAYETYNWDNQSIEVSWDFIFYHISPLMLNEAEQYQLKTTLNRVVGEYELPGLQNLENAKGHKFKNFVINNDDFHTIMIQLRALGLITQSNKARSVKDTDTYWTLTPYGDGVMNKLRAIEKAEAENV